MCSVDLSSSSCQMPKSVLMSFVQPPTSPVLARFFPKRFIDSGETWLAEQWMCPCEQQTPLTFATRTDDGRRYTSQPVVSSCLLRLLRWLIIRNSQALRASRCKLNLLTAPTAQCHLGLPPFSKLALPCEGPMTSHDSKH